MSIKIGNISAKDIYIGSTPAKEIRLGSTLIWSRESEIYYTLTLNLGEGVDYTDIWYREPNSSEWVEASKTYSITAPEGTEYYIEAGYLEGYSPDTSINLGSELYPLTLNSNTTIYVYAIQKEQYELNIQVKHNGYASEVEQLTVKVDGDIALNEYNYTGGANITHDGTKPIEVQVSDLKSLSDWEWSGSIQPIVGANRQCHWDSLPESGILTINFTN